MRGTTEVDWMHSGTRFLNASESNHVHLDIAPLPTACVARERAPSLGLCHKDESIPPFASLKTGREMGRCRAGMVINLPMRLLRSHCQCIH